VLLKTTVSYSTRLRVGRSGVPIPVWAKDFSLLHTLQTGSGAHPTSYSMGTGILSQGKVAGA